MMNNKMTKQEMELLNLANKCLTQTKNSLYFRYQALSPAIYRMPVDIAGVGSMIFGTDASKIYIDPMRIISCYRESPEKLMRAYLHMLFHCIYLHPFMKWTANDKMLWGIAMDICAESAIMRLDNLKAIDGDSERANVINEIKDNVKMFLPNLVYKELQKDKYDIEHIFGLFYMDDHLWMEQSESGQNGQQNGNGNNQQSNGNGNNKQDQNDGGNGDGNGDDNKDNKGGNGGGNNNKNNQNQNQSQSQSQSNQKKQEWSDVNRQISTDMQSFNKQQGTEAGNVAQELDYVTQDKMDYSEFLRQFSVTEERMKINQDEFDYMFYTYGLGLETPTGDKMLLIEPLEYKEEKVIKDFVIAIDTSGSCSGDLVKKFVNKTYSILKESESFSSRVNIHIIQCDARVQNDTKITNKEEMEEFIRNMKLYGFGGTDFRPVFEYVDDLIKNKEFENLCGLIYFTDGYGTYPSNPTPYKTAFAFLEDYNNRDDVPAWAMSVYWNEDEA